MRRVQKTSAEQVVLKLSQIEVRTAQGKSLALTCKGGEDLQTELFRAHPGPTRDRSCGVLASLRGLQMSPHDGIRGSGRSCSQAARSAVPTSEFPQSYPLPSSHRDLLRAGVAQCCICWCVEFTFDWHEGRRGRKGEAARARVRGRGGAHTTSCRLKSGTAPGRRASLVRHCNAGSEIGTPGDNRIDDGLGDVELPCRHARPDNA